MKDYYTVLGCDRSVTFEDLKKRYQELVLKYHPDKQRCCGDETNSFSQIDEAWKTLRDPLQRKAYDAELMQSRYENPYVIYANLELSELNWQSDISAYSYPCRCGGTYIIPTESEHDGYLVSCDECSLVISIKPEDLVKGNAS